MATVLACQHSLVSSSASARHVTVCSQRPAGITATCLQACQPACRAVLSRSRKDWAVRASNRLFDDGEDDDSAVATMEGGDDEWGLPPPDTEYREEWPNPQFIEKTLKEFPEAGIADVEQARVLYSNGGYTYLDVRPSIECEDIGKVRGSVNVPIMNSVRRYDPEQKKKVTKKTPNDNFVKDVEKRFKNKDTKLLIGCSNGTTYSIDALEALDEAGYENIVGLKGGYYAWFNVFTNKLERRRSGEYAETYTHDGDSAGIHSSGAGFDRVDKADAWVPPEY